MVKKGYKQTEIGVIPEDWDISPLAAAFPKLEAGVSVNSDNILSSEYHVLKTSAVHNGVVDVAETKPIVPQDYHRVKCPLVKGSMVISRMNTPSLVGECGFVKKVKNGTYLPDRLWQVKNPPGSGFDFEWLNYLLNTKQYRDAVRATATGTSNSMKNISKERLLEIKIPHPPIDEQGRIASVLSNLDELIHLVEQQISKKKAIKQGAMQELLTGKKRLPCFDATKSTVKLSDVAEIKDGTHGTYNRVSNGVLLLSAKNIFNNHMEITENESMISTDDYFFAMFYKKRFLDLVHNFVVFDKGIKKVCRYNQYYAIKRTQHRLTGKQRGGIVWHTQGSGKSLTMVWLSKWILANNPNARVLIVTDREELDEQIEKNFVGVDEQIVRTKSGKDLLERLDSHEDRLLCSLVHKFGRRGSDSSEQDYHKYIEELKSSLPGSFSAKGDIVVFVDECHRTQSGKLHEAMKVILPKAIFIGFTGTPLLKKDKKTSLETFGGYIHTYKFNEGVRDGVVLDLRYEARDVPQDITSQARIDAWFDAKTVGLAPRAKAKLKAHWGNLQKIFSSRSRLEQIANDIIFDFATKARLMDGNGNAILVAGSVYSACRYYEIFQAKGFKKCAIISSYTPQAGDLRTDTVSDDEETETFEKYNTYLKMIGVDPADDKAQIAGKVAEFEKEAKRKFVEEPANMKLLIVVDKLLTGFDAPSCTYLYIDKAMHDHGLFQAICRVNRLDGESKDFGYIVDYKELFGDLADAMNKYTAGAFEAYDQEDVEGLLKDRTSEAKKYFESTLDELDELCEGVEFPREELDYIHYFCGESGTNNEQDEAYARIREKLYKLVGRLIRAYAELKPRMVDAGYSSAEQEKLEERVTFYISLRETIGRASGDFIDLKAYEPGMRYLIDNYISASESKTIGSMEDFTLLDFIVTMEDKLGNDENKSEQESAAETIENNIRKKVVERMVVNPAYYAKMSAILEQLILDRKRGVIAYGQLLETYMELAKNVTKPEENEKYPESVRYNSALRALYDNCGEDEKHALKLHKVIVKARQEGFRNNPVKENKIKRALYQLLNDEDEVERIYQIVYEQEEY